MKDGCAAFPYTTDGYHVIEKDANENICAEISKFKHHEGMSLRDYFAAKALTGMLAYSINNSYNQANGSPEDIANGAYAFADAMIKESEK